VIDELSMIRDRAEIQKRPREATVFGPRGLPATTIVTGPWKAPLALASDAPVVAAVTPAGTANTKKRTANARRTTIHGRLAHSFAYRFAPLAHPMIDAARLRSVSNE
jgi:hypothetical protein